MKTLFYAIVVLFLGGMTTMTQAQVKVVASGDVGIGQDVPESKLHVNGAGKFEQNLFVGEGVGTGDAIIELGTGRTGDGNAGFDLAATQADGADFGVRFLRFSTGLSQFSHKGDGPFVFTALDNATIFFRTNDVNRFRANFTGLTPGADDVYDLGTPLRRWQDVYATNGTIQTSDARMKTKVHDIEYGLNEILKLRPVTYYWKDNVAYGRKIGLIAQEVQPIINEVVKSSDVIFDADGTKQKRVTQNAYLGMNYAELIPVLVKAIQEQNSNMDEENEALHKEVENLKNELEDLRNLVSQQNELLDKIIAQEEPHNIDVLLQGKSPQLLQNQPNPFTHETVISYFIPERASNALIQIHDIDGRLMKNVSIDQRGEGTLSIEAKELQSGTYSYTLIVDNQLVDSKRMVLTR